VYKGMSFERTWSGIEVLTDNDVLMKGNRWSLLVILEMTQR